MEACAIIQAIKQVLKSHEPRNKSFVVFFNAADLRSMSFVQNL